MLTFTVSSNLNLEIESYPHWPSVTFSTVASHTSADDDRSWDAILNVTRGVVGVKYAVDVWTQSAVGKASGLGKMRLN
jgi:hypothetical protein